VAGGNSCHHGKGYRYKEALLHAYTTFLKNIIETTLTTLATNKHIQVE